MYAPHTHTKKKKGQAKDRYLLRALVCVRGGGCELVEPVTCAAEERGGLFETPFFKQLLALGHKLGGGGGLKNTQLLRIGQRRHHAHEARAHARARARARSILLGLVFFVIIIVADAVLAIVVTNLSVGPQV